MAADLGAQGPNESGFDHEAIEAARQQQASARWRLAQGMGRYDDPDAGDGVNAAMGGLFDDDAGWR